MSANTSTVTETDVTEINAKHGIVIPLEEKVLIDNMEDVENIVVSVTDKEMEDKHKMA